MATNSRHLSLNGGVYVLPLESEQASEYNNPRSDAERML